LIELPGCPTADGVCCPEWRRLLPPVHGAVTAAAMLLPAPGRNLIQVSRRQTMRQLRPRLQREGAVVMHENELIL